MGFDTLSQSVSEDTGTLLTCVVMTTDITVVEDAKVVLSSSDYTACSYPTNQGSTYTNFQQLSISSQQMTLDILFALWYWRTGVTSNPPELNGVNQ